MRDSFDIPVTYENKNLAFTATLLQFGYSHKFAVNVNGVQVFFEPDEERNYRALLDPAELEKNKGIDAGLLKAISMAIESLVK